MIRNILIGLSLLFGISGFVISMKNMTRKTVYINMGKIYEEFKLSKELNKDLENTFKMRKHILDSLYEDLKKTVLVMEQKKDADKESKQYLKQMEESYLYRQQTFEQENRDASASCNEKIWNQINQYVEDYGTEKNYMFILGANGQGNIMYGDRKIDVTDEIISYLNTRYEDKSK